jgi:hypothetical protein
MFQFQLVTLKNLVFKYLLCDYITFSSFKEVVLYSTVVRLHGLTLCKKKNQTILFQNKIPVWQRYQLLLEKIIK